MLSKVLATLERLIADAARKWLEGHMNPQVRSQMVSLLADLGATWISASQAPIVFGLSANMVFAKMSLTSSRQLVAYAVIH